MKKDKIIKSSLSTLLKRFSKTDIISSLSNERTSSTSFLLPLEKIKDNSILKPARINEKLLEKRTQMMKESTNSFPLYVISKNDEYEVVFPRVYYKAAKRLKLQTVPCYLLDLSEDGALLFLASTLLQDRDTSIIEMSLIFNKIKSKLHYSQKEIASAMGLSRSQVTNIMRLIDMPKPILDDVADGKLSFGHVRAISTLSELEMFNVVNDIYEQRLSVHDVELLVYSIKHHDHVFKKTKEVEKKYSCTVKGSPKKLSISFSSVEEKEKFINQLLKQ